jgi:FdhD protein
VTTHRATPATREIRLTRYEAGERRVTDDELAAEEPIEIRVEGQSISVVMRTPGHDRELAVGFLYSEGLIESARDVFDVTTCVTTNPEYRGNIIDVGLTRPGTFDPARFSRHVLTSASCGLCGKVTIEEALRRRPALESDLRISPEMVLSLPEELKRHQEAFHRTGGLHACALFTTDGKLEQVREDIGRHNALDKLVGWALLENRLPLREHVLLLSGRVSFEMMQKAQAAGLAIVAAISAPSSLAVQLAEQSGQTLAGFLRGRSMNLYTHPERIQ